jgi:hypothetical protein
MTELERRLDELEITGLVRREMLAEPERALLIVEAAGRARGVHNRAAFTIARWKARAQTKPASAPAPELEAIPPTLESLEYLWGRRPTVVGDLILKLIAAALERHGGFRALQADFHRHRSGRS